MKTRLLLRSIAVVIAGGVIVACNDAPVGPTGPYPPPPPPDQPVLRSLELTGEATIAPGATSDFTLIAVYANGTRTDVTTTARWSVSDFNNASRFATVPGPGRVQGVASGETRLHVGYGVLNVSRDIIVVPEGTFRVTGRITENDFITPVANAHIRVRDATETGPTTETDNDGYYRLYGVKRETDFVVTREGFQDTELRVTIDKHSTVNVVVPLAGPRLNVEGNYTVTFEWTKCFGGFPDHLKRRVYGAVVKQLGAQIEARFTEPEFALNSASRGNVMTGRVDPSGMHLYADSGYDSGFGPNYGASLTEVLPDNYRLVAWGRTFVARSGNRFAGPLSGGAYAYQQAAPRDIGHGNCSDGNVTFERR